MKTSRRLITLPALLLGSIFLVFSARSPLAEAEEASLLQPRGLAFANHSSKQINEETKLALTGCDSLCCDHGQGKCCRENGKAICCPKRVEKEVKKHFRKVNSEIVCIPKFRWPWERCASGNSSCDRCCGNERTAKHGCCPPLCGRTRCIHVLEKHETKCKECGYEWQIKYIRGKSPAGCCPSCGGKSCCDQ